ncbi:MAG: rpsQ [Dehalococcoidia bacterium]|nr:rpsQ [Dehalococcoidia bacterium]
MMVKARHKTMEGVVVSDKMDKTVVVVVETRKPHPLYRRIIKSRKRFKVHDESNVCVVGDLVQITESRPLSKDKRWRVAAVLGRGLVATEETQLKDEIEGLTDNGTALVGESDSNTDSEAEAESEMGDQSGEVEEKL